MTEMIQVVVPPAVQQSFREWLASHSWELFPIPSGDDDLPTYGIRRKDEDHD